MSFGPADQFIELSRFAQLRREIEREYLKVIVVYAMTRGRGGWRKTYFRFAVFAEAVVVLCLCIDA